MKNSFLNDPSIDQGWLLENPERQLSWSRTAYRKDKSYDQLRQFIYMQMAASDLLHDQEAMNQVELPEGLLANLEEKHRLVAQMQAPCDQRIEAFLEEHFKELAGDSPLRLPKYSLTLSQHGMARELSLPDGGSLFQNQMVSSYRLANGVLHNPKADRRTTQGTFHVAEGGLPIAGDKRAVPKHVFMNLFRAAIHPPKENLLLPFTMGRTSPVETWVSLLIRPLVRPRVPGYCQQQTMEVRFFAPGGLVSNLDFVESIFGNAGDPLLPDNDAALDVEHWTGHSGCVILAPHLIELTKQQLGLPHFDQATQRQRRDGMCWKDPSEKYNDSVAFKATCRTAEGVIVTLIADNYYGYCKKEVKTQISYSANLLGNVEEEHAGGTLAFITHNLGDEFQWNSRRYNGRTMADLMADYSDFIDWNPDGYGVDKNFPSLIYVREDARASIPLRSVLWQIDGIEKRIPLEQGKIYMSPSGYKVEMEKHPCAPSWRLIGTAGDGTVCHKPCTVSGGGKSEISKSLTDYMQGGSIFVSDIDSDFDRLDEIFNKDYSNRWRDGSPEKPDYNHHESRRVLDTRRSLGSVIKLLTPSKEYTDDYNAWLAKIPSHIYAMAFIIKRFYKEEWQGDWRSHFGVDIVNGEPGHELKYDNRKLVGMYLHVGLDVSGRWRMYKLRQDFAAARKIQLQDDITASIVVPGRELTEPFTHRPESFKFVANCEYRLFQRPDDAVHRGLDKQTEKDIADAGNFFCNFEPLGKPQVAEEAANIIELEQYSAPMRERLEGFLESKFDYVVSSATADGRWETVEEPSVLAGSP